MKIKVTDDNGDEKTYDADTDRIDMSSNLCLYKGAKKVAVYRDHCWESLEYIKEGEESK